MVFAGTRQIYGRARLPPVDEACRPEPVDFNGIHKFAATVYHELLSRIRDMDAVVLPHQRLRPPDGTGLPLQGFLGTSLRCFHRRPADVYGDGRRRGTPSTWTTWSSFSIAGARDSHKSALYNGGGPEALRGGVAEAIAAAAGLPPVIQAPFPVQQKAIDIGSYFSNSQLIRRELGWRPWTRFRDGVERTLAYYRKHLNSDLSQPGTHPDLRAVALAKRAAEL